MMRVTFTQINDNVQRNLASNYAQLAKLQEQLSSGRRLNRPSDDPIDMKNNVNLKAELAQGTQYHRNIEDGLAWMNMTEVALTDMNELMQRLREQAVYAGNDTMTGTDRQYIAAEVEQLLRQVVSLTNSSYKGNFLFGGTNGDKQVYEYTTGTTFSFDNSTPATTLGAVGTTNTMVTYSNREYYQYQRLDPNTVSVVIDPAGAGTRAIEGQDFTVDYANGTITAIAGGQLDFTLAPPPPPTVAVTLSHYNKVNRENSSSIMREIEEGVSTRINISADEAFDDTQSGRELIGIILNFKDGLLKNNGTVINDSITEMDRIFENIRAAQSTNGARINRFELTRDRNESREIEVTRLQGELEDLDFAEAIMQFSMSENIYNASLRAGAKVILPTLGDFI